MPAEINEEFEPIEKLIHRSFTRVGAWEWFFARAKLYQPCFHLLAKEMVPQLMHALEALA